MNQNSQVQTIIDAAHRLANAEIDEHVGNLGDDFEEALVALHSAIVDYEDDLGTNQDSTRRIITAEDEAMACVATAAIAWEEVVFGEGYESHPDSATGRLHAAIVNLKTERESNRSPGAKNIVPPKCGVCNNSFGNEITADGDWNCANCKHRWYSHLNSKDESESDTVEHDFKSPDYQEMADQIERLQIDFGSGLANNHINTYVLGKQYFQLALAALETARANMQLCCYMVRRKE
jgi:hypothetical protein